VRINLDFVNVVTYLPVFQFLLRKELEPFIIRVGEIRIEEIPNGLEFCGEMRGKKYGSRIISDSLPSVTRHP
jgi:hypothetical protein